MTRAPSRVVSPPAPRDLPLRGGGSFNDRRNSRVDEFRSAWEDARNEVEADEGLALELTTRMGGMRYSSDGGGD